MLYQIVLIVSDYNGIVNELLTIKIGEHNILIYEDVGIFGKVYSKYCKYQLSTANHVVLILIFNEDEEKVLQNLSDEGIDVEKNRADGSLLIEDSVLEFFGSGADMLDYLSLLQKYCRDIGKDGLTIILDIGGLYLLGSEADLLKFELSIASSSQKYLTDASLLCCYHIALFGKIGKDSRNRIATQHQKTFYTLDQ
jgi:hypothetical protein